MRLPPRPDLHWKEDGTPVDERVGDVYYSVADGLAESEAVFLKPSGLPERWQNGQDFTIGELGFGTGLNFLATWRLWQAHRLETGWLHFVSFEGYPLDADDAGQALSVWPELKPLVDQLIARWPIRAKGLQQIVWPQERLTLTLHIGLIEETFAQSGLKADAWFLDGFSPAKNSAMWDEQLWAHVAERCKPGASVATFTVAGAVRRGLSEAGFEVSKQPGFGRKRERLEAVFPAVIQSRPGSVSSPKVAIVGAGISGAMLANTLRARGAEVSVFDRSSGPGQGTSGNPLALVMPRLDAGDTPQARLLVEAYVTALQAYAGKEGVSKVDVLHRPKDETERVRFEKMLRDPPLGLEHLEATASGVLHKQALIVEPAKLLPALLEHVACHWGCDAAPDFQTLSINGEPFDHIVDASGWHMQTQWQQLRLEGRSGQVDWVTSDVEAPASCIASGHYALALGPTRLWGATFERMEPQSDPLVSAMALAKNADALKELNPFWLGQAQSLVKESKVGVRATTPDRLPVIGGLPNFARLDQDYAYLRQGTPGGRRVEDYERVSGVWICGGFGSRGFTWAPWAARLITAEIFRDPSPTTYISKQLVSVARQRFRDLKRNII